jgi:uncharacterized protein with HEPN domain
MYVDDNTRARHMRDAAAEALGFASGLQRPDLDRDRMLYRSLVSCMVEIGEAASKTTPEFRASLGQVPWTSIVGMRNRLIHGYYLVDPDILWETVTVHLSPLLAALDEWLASQSDEAQPCASIDEEKPC